MEDKRTKTTDVYKPNSVTPKKNLGAAIICLSLESLLNFSGLPKSLLKRTALIPMGVTFLFDLSPSGAFHDPVSGNLFRDL